MIRVQVIIVVSAVVILLVVLTLAQGPASKSFSVPKLARTATPTVAQDGAPAGQPGSPIPLSTAVRGATLPPIPLTPTDNRIKRTSAFVAHERT